MEARAGDTCVPANLLFAGYAVPNRHSSRLVSPGLEYQSSISMELSAAAKGGRFDNAAAIRVKDRGLCIGCFITRVDLPARLYYRPG